MRHGEGLESDRTTRAFDRDRTCDVVQVEDRRIARPFGLDEDVPEAVDEPGLRRLVRPDGQAGALVEDDHAQIVDAVHMVGVAVGVNHAIEVADAFAQKLLAQIGRGVDQNAGCAVAIIALDQQRTPGAGVFRIVRVAVAPVPAKARHAAR